MTRDDEFEVFLDSPRVLLDRTGLFSMYAVVLSWRSEAAQRAGLIRSVLTVVGIYDTPPADRDATGRRWQVVCERHDEATPANSLAQAKRHAMIPYEWCAGCDSELAQLPAGSPPDRDRPS
jgi:hypothetical protein